MGTIIAVTSAKGGTGKTTAAANIGAAFAETGANVLVMDLNVGSGGLDVVMGLREKVIYNLADVLEGGCRISQALIVHPELPRLRLLAGGRLRLSERVSGGRISKLLGLFVDEFDYVILDVPERILFRDERVLSAVDVVLLLSDPGPMSVLNTEGLLLRLSEEERKKCFLILSRVRYDLLKRGETETPEEIASRLKLPILGIILEDDDILLETARGAFVTPIGTVACRSFRNIAKRISGENVPIVLKK